MSRINLITNHIILHFININIRVPIRHSFDIIFFIQNLSSINRINHINFSFQKIFSQNLKIKSLFIIFYLNIIQSLIIHIINSHITIIISISINIRIIYIITILIITCFQIINGPIQTIKR